MADLAMYRAKHRPELDYVIANVDVHDPIRYEEYRRYANNHKNPEKRRQAVWKLAREGCSGQGSSDDYQRGYRSY